jgi:hypothetical protein
MAFLYSYGMLWRDDLPPFEHLFDYDLIFASLCSRRSGIGAWNCACHYLPLLVFGVAYATPTSD